MPAELVKPPLMVLEALNVPADPPVELPPSPPLPPAPADAVDVAVPPLPPAPSPDWA